MGCGCLHEGQTAFYMKTDKVPLLEYQRTDYKYDRQPSPGTPLRVPEDRLREGQTSLPLVYPSRNARGQTTCRTDEVFLWCTLLGMPEDRLTYIGQTKLVYPSRDARGQTTCRTDKPSPGVPISGCQRTDYM